MPKQGNLGPMTKSWYRHTDRLPWVGPAAVLAVAGALLIGTTWHPVGDSAIAEIIVRHAWTTRPLFGPYSSQHPFRHLLPVNYALVWLPYELSGRRSSAQLAATVWFNGAIIVLLLAITKRYHCLGLGLVLLGGIVVSERANRLGHLAVPWNPYLGFVPLIALVVVVWQTVLGHRWLLPVAASLAVWMVGVHIAYVPTVVGLGLVTLVGLPYVTVRRHGLGGLRGLIGPLLVSVAVAVALTLPALVDLAAHGTRSNPVQLVHWFRHPSGAVLPASRARNAVLGDLSIHGTWLSGNQSVDRGGPSTTTPFPAFLLLGLAALAAALVRRAHEELAALATVTVALVATIGGLFAVRARVLVDWYLLPLHASVLCFCCVAAWSLGRSISHLARARLGSDVTVWPEGRGLLAGGIATVLALLLVPTLRDPAEAQGVYRPPLSVASIVVQRVPKTHTVVLEAPFAYSVVYGAAAALDLDRAGYTVRYRRSDAYLFTQPLTVVPAGRPVTVLYVAQESHARSRGRPSARSDVSLLGSAPLTPGQTSEYPRLSVWEVRPR